MQDQNWLYGIVVDNGHGVEDFENGVIYGMTNTVSEGDFRDGDRVIFLPRKRRYRKRLWVARILHRT